MTWTYYFRRIVKNPAYYGVKDTSSNGINQFIVKLIDQNLEVLAKNACIEIGEDDFTLQPTFLGQIASFYYLNPGSVYQFKKALKPNLSIFKLLEVISNAKEFDEVPVRHNEDNLNDGLARLCPYRVNLQQIDSPHVKTLLLYQAYFS